MGIRKLCPNAVEFHMFKGLGIHLVSVDKLAGMALPAKRLSYVMSFFRKGFSQ